MDNSNIGTQESAWISSGNRVEYETDIILRFPRFSSIERFLVYGGGAPFVCTAELWKPFFPKDSNAVTNIMNDLTMKATSNLKAIRSVIELNGLLGLHDRIVGKTYTGTSDLIFWMKESLDLHGIV